MALRVAKYTGISNRKYWKAKRCERGYRPLTTQDKKLRRSSDTEKLKQVTQIFS